MNDKEKPLAEIDFLRIENAKLKIDLMQIRVQERAAELNVLIQEIAEREGVKGWQLDMQNRKWIAPEN